MLYSYRICVHRLNLKKCSEQTFNIADIVVPGRFLIALVFMDIYCHS